MSSKKRIAFININNPQDKSLRNGVPYSICQELLKEFDVVWIKTEITGIYSLLHQLVRIYEKIVRAMGYNPINNPFRSWLKGKSLGKKIEKINMMQYFRQIAKMLRIFCSFSLLIFIY